MQKLQFQFVAPADSPSLSSPPMAHFDPDEPIVDDPVTLEQSHKPDEENDRTHRDSSPALFANLETRRKRRPSALIRDPSEESEIQPERIEPLKDVESEPALKAGAKRKFTVQEQENEESRLTRSDASNFSFSRKSSSTIDKPISRQVKPLPERIIDKSEERLRHATKEIKARRALGESEFETA